MISVSYIWKVLNTMNVGTLQEGVRRGEGRREALRRVLPRRLRPGEGPAGVGVRRFGGRTSASADSRFVENNHCFTNFATLQKRNEIRKKLQRNVFDF